MDRQDCKNWNKCNAPLCPLVSGNDGIWYPDEDICILREHGRKRWITNQKKIAKRGAPGTYFTKRMLGQRLIVKAGIKGLDPEKDYSSRPRLENEWIESRKGITRKGKPLTEEQKKELVKRLQKGRKDKK